MTHATDHPALGIEITPLKEALCEERDRNLEVLVRIQAQQSAPVARTPLSVALVIDRSGSMRGDRLAAAKACARELLTNLHADDEVSVVTYDSKVAIPLKLAPVREALTSIDALLESIECGGNTDLHGGWLAGAGELAPRAGKNRMCRVILLSDGRANHGIIFDHEIVGQTRKLAGSGVTTTTVGLGLGFNEHLMTAMAVAGQGNAHYGERAADLAEPLESEIALLSHLAWRDVRLNIGSATSRWKLLNDYPSTGDEAQWTLPSIPADAEAWACFRVPMPSAVRAQQRSRRGQALHLTVRARDAQGVEHAFTASLPALKIVSATAWDAMPADELVARRLAELQAARLQRSARQAVSQHDWDEAGKVLDEIRALADSNPWIGGTLNELEALLRQRDHLRMEKELVYMSMRMGTRLAGLDEGSDFDRTVESTKAAYLRRKAIQGRGDR